MSRQKLRYRKTRKERLIQFLKDFRRVKFGVIGLIILSGFFAMALLAPILFPVYPGLRFVYGVGPNASPPAWQAFFDPLWAPTGNYVPDPYFYGDTNLEFNTSNPDVGFFSYDENEVYFGNQSVRLGFIDSDDSMAFHENVSAKMAFPFSYRAPANIRINLAMKSLFSGNFTKYSFLPYVRIDVPEHINVDSRFHHFTFLTYADYWEIYEGYIPEFLSFFIFKPGAEIKMEFGVKLVESDPNCTGMIEVWFDKMEILGERKAYGLLGTTQYGNDVLAQIFWSTHVTIFIAVCTAVLTSVIGLAVGVTAGYVGGFLDELLMGISTFFLIIPVIPVLMVLMVLLQGASYSFLILILSILWWPRTARMVRSQVLVEKEKLYVESARASGASSFYIIFRTLVPSVMTIFFVQFALTAATAIVIEANLGFFDYLHNFDEWRGTVDSPLFLPINYVSWGRMLGAAYYNGAISGGEWWLFVPAGLCLTLFALGWVFFGHGINTVMNPKLRLLQRKR